MHKLKQLPLILSLLIFSCTGKKETDPVLAAQGTFFRTIATNDISLEQPVEGEWSYTHNEREQTLEEYETSNPIHPSNNQNIIYLRPYSAFSAQEQQILAYTAEYLSIFYQLKVKVGQSIADEIIPNSARRRRSDGTEQLLATYFTDTLLKRNLQPNAVALMAVTEKDLYPKADWNFVFVCSIKRLYQNLSDSVNFTTCLSRLINITSHEIGHMFGLHHCVASQCVMNGSNSLAESDLQPARLCSRCLKKLYWNIRFNNEARLNALTQFFYTHRLKKDYFLADEDVRKLLNAKGEEK
jgi:archaemetzincin